MRSPDEIITDAEVIAVHANANFGDMPPREVVNEGVRKYAIGYSGGHTQQCILREHGLITKGKGYNADLTKKGKEYARAVDRDTKDTIARLTAELTETRERLTLERRKVQGLMDRLTEARADTAAAYEKAANRVETLTDGCACCAGSSHDIRALATESQTTALVEMLDAETRACADVCEITAGRRDEQVSIFKYQNTITCHGDISKMERWRAGSQQSLYNRDAILARIDQRKEAGK